MLVVLDRSIENEFNMAPPPGGDSENQVRSDENPASTIQITALLDYLTSAP